MTNERILAVSVTYNGVTKAVAVEDAVLETFVSRCIQTFSIPSTLSLPSLVFETLTSDVCAAVITTDLALRVVLGATKKTGRLILNHSNNLPSIDQSIQTVLKAVADTAAAQREAASIFMALSGAYNPTTSSTCTNNNNNNINNSSCNHCTLTSNDIDNNQQQCLISDVIIPDGVDDLTNQMGALSCFCTHTGIACSECNMYPIMGSRYVRQRQPQSNLCERCRRAMSNASPTNKNEYVVYEHPWESTEEYGEDNEDDLQAPKPPLKQGDQGPRVLHLHYILYKIGYLSVARPWFKPGVYCANTSDIIGRLHSDNNVDSNSDLGVYSLVTRSIMLALLEDHDSITSSLRCSSLSDSNDPPATNNANNSIQHMRMALAA